MYIYVNKVFDIFILFPFDHSISMDIYAVRGKLVVPQKTFTAHISTLIIFKGKS